MSTELITRRIRFTAAVKAATLEMARSKPWKGEREERKAKFQAFHKVMCKANEVECDLEFIDTESDETSLLSRMYPAGNPVMQNQRPVIVLVGKLSLVTYLHLFGYAIDLDQIQRFQFSLNLFRIYFPKSFAKAQAEHSCLGL